MAIFYYEGLGGCKSVCDLEVDQLNSIIVLTERGDNPGTSITNMIEGLTNRIVSDFLVNSKKITCFEIYNSASYNGLKHEDYSNISLVQFTFQDGKFVDPKWSFYEGGEFFDFLETVKSPLAASFSHYQ